MSFAIQTPAKPLPGTYLQTPAANKLQSATTNQSNFASNFPKSSQQLSAPIPLQSTQLATRPADTLNSIERAAKTINEVLNQEARYPELDGYIGRRLQPTLSQVSSLTIAQKASPPTMTYHLGQHGRLFKKSRCTIYQTRYSSSTIAPKCLQ